MKQISIALAGALCIAASGAAVAQSKKVGTIPVKEGSSADSVGMPTKLSYTHADLGYEKSDYDGLDVTGFGLSGSFLLPSSVTFSLPLYVTAGYAKEEFDDLSSAELTTMRVGLGYRYGLTSSVDLKAEVDFNKVDVDVGSASDDDTGFRAGVGARAMVLPQLEAGGGVRYHELFEETFLEVNGLYHIARGFAAGVSYSYSSDISTLAISGRYNFGF